MPDVVLGAAIGYTAAQVDPFLRSLRASGYGGEVVLLVAPTLRPADARAMRAHGVKLEVVQRELSRLPREWAERRFTRRLNPLHRRAGPLLARLPGRFGRAARGCYSAAFHHPAVSRFADCLRFLDPRAGRYQRVLLSDVRDVVFQADPFAAPLPAPLVCALESDLTRIGAEASNAAWMRRFHGEAALTGVADRRVANVGTVFGTAAGVTGFLAALVREVVGTADRGVGQFGTDQSALNLLLWTGRLPAAATAENGGRLVFTAANEDLRRFRIAGGVLLAHDGHPVAVVHQYDRDPQLRRLAAAQLRTSG